MTEKIWEPGGRVRPVGAQSVPPGPCGMCGGRGYSWVEDANGAPLHQVTCAFCGGRRDNSWVQEEADLVEEAAERLRNITLAVAVGFSILFAYGWDNVESGSALPAFAMLIGMVGLFGCLCFFFYERGRQRRVDASQVPPAPPDPFTTPEEVRKVRQAQAAAALGLFLWQLGERHRRH